MPLYYVGFGQSMAVLGGLVVGGFVCGKLTRRRGLVQWIGAFLAVLFAQLAMGLLVIAATPA